MKEFRLVLNEIPGDWISVKDIKLETLIRTGNELDDLGYKNWYLEWR